MLREGSSQKRRAIIAAGSTLFLRDGYDRSSVDEIAEAAGVSKRTLYDYFGDKAGLLRAVLDDASTELLAQIRQAIDRLADVPLARDIQTALIDFAEEAGRNTLGSPHYAALLRLQREGAGLGDDASQLGQSHPINYEPERALAARFAEWGRGSLLEVPDPAIAADHFIALTFFVAGTRPKAPSERERSAIIRAGVDAFLRAYGPRG